MNNRVAVCTANGGYLYSLPGEKVRLMLEAGLAKVAECRRGQVMRVQLPPVRLRRVGNVTDGVGVGTRYVVRGRLAKEIKEIDGNVGLVASGLRAFRHCDEAILDYPDAFLAVVADRGANVIEDVTADARRTCLSKKK